MTQYFLTPGCFEFTLLWMIMLSSTIKSIAASSQESFLSQANVVLLREERSPDEESFQSRIPKKVEDYESAEEDLNEYTSQQSSREELPSENIPDEYKDSLPRIKGDLNKNKQNEPKKYYGNDFKNKVNLETKNSSGNESAIEKQKLQAYNPNPVLKYNNSFKKDLKSNLSLSDYNFKGNTSNLKVPSKFILEKKKLKSDSSDVPLNITKVAKLNETRLMSDQPVATDSDLTHNTTDISEDDAFDGLMPNTTLPSEEKNHTNENNETIGSTLPSEEIDIVVVSGVTLVTAVLLGVAAGGGFVYYRHKMWWNKPQTFSDKGSNADSSGYIDDSTLRENSEEMYSLDNDSFLNSLEAMTIQNYWTDNVKHTKL